MATVYVLPVTGPFKLSGAIILIVTLAITLFIGSRIGLSVCVFLSFIILALPFWYPLVQSNTNFLPASYSPIVFTLLLIMLTVVTGYIRDQVVTTYGKHAELAERLQQLVAVDTETWLDNDERFLLEVQAEFDRIQRHGGQFTVILYQIPGLRGFESRHGKTEYEWFLNYFSDQLHLLTRRTDKKYRIDVETFGLVMPLTPIDEAGEVMSRLDEVLKEYELLSGDFLTFDSRLTSLTMNLQEGTERINEVIRLVRHLQTNEND